MGKYDAVLRRYGKRGFGRPSKAPDVGSFPLYPLGRARYALTIIASPNYDSKKKLRESISKRAIIAHPSLKSYWSQLNRETIKPRLSKSRYKKAANPRRNTMARRRNYGSLRTLENPYGLSLGRGKAVRTASGDRTHIMGEDGRTLCGAKIDKSRPSDAKVITCYRCIKLVNMDGLNTRERSLRYGKRSKHYMIPGGREGKYVSGVDVGSSLSDAEFEAMMGDENYPTQSLGMIERIRQEQTGAKRKRAGRKGALTRRRKKAASAMIANPRSYKLGVAKGRKDYHSPKPTSASILRQRSMSYQRGYLQGYSEAADKRYSKPNPKRRRNTRRRRR